MFKKACLLCKIVGAVGIVGLLNYGSIGIFHVNFIENILGMGRLAAIIYVLMGASGVALLVSYFMVCPACKK